MHVIMLSLNSHREPQPAKPYESDNKMLTGSAGDISDLSGFLKSSL